MVCEAVSRCGQSFGCLRCCAAVARVSLLTMSSGKKKAPAAKAAKASPTPTIAPVTSATTTTGNTDEAPSTTPPSTSPSTSTAPVSAPPSRKTSSHEDTSTWQRMIADLFEDETNVSSRYTAVRSSTELLVVAAIFALALACYVPAIWGEYVYDDKVRVRAYLNTAPHPRPLT